VGHEITLRNCNSRDRFCLQPFGWRNGQDNESWRNRLCCVFVLPEGMPEGCSGASPNVAYAQGLQDVGATLKHFVHFEAAQ